MMMRKILTRLMPALFCVVLGACATAPEGASDTTEPSEADALARQVVETSGEPSEVDELAFSFVVEKGGEELVRRRHIWRPQDGEVVVSNDDQRVTLEKIDEYDLSEIADDPQAHTDTWRAVAPQASPEDAAQAWAWFVNDSYWLLAPTKLFDPGVNRTLDDEGRLVLTFGQVGLTPGDRYTLEVDDETGLVTGWEFELEGGNEGSFDWTDYERFGPLMLSTRKVARDGDTMIRFEEIEATQ